MRPSTSTVIGSFTSTGKRNNIAELDGIFCLKYIIFRIYSKIQYSWTIMFTWQALY